MEDKYLQKKLFNIEWCQKLLISESRMTKVMTAWCWINQKRVYAVTDSITSTLLKFFPWDIWYTCTGCWYGTSWWWSTSITKESGGFFIAYICCRIKHKGWKWDITFTWIFSCWICGRCFILRLTWWPDIKHKLIKWRRKAH